MLSYENESSAFLRSNALLRIGTRLSGSFPKGNHRATKALLVFSGLQPTDHNTWGVDTSIVAPLKESDKEFMTNSFVFNVFSCRPDKDFALAVELHEKHSMEDAKKISALSSLTITEPDLYM